MATAEIPQSESPFQIPPRVQKKLEATAGIEDTPVADQTSILQAKEWATGDVGGARYETGEVHQERGKKVKIDLRRLGPGQQITADVGPEEVAEDIRRKSEGAVKELPPDQRAIALEGLAAAKKVLGIKD